MPAKHTEPAWSSTSSVVAAANRVLWGAIILIWLLVYAPGLFRPSLLDDADTTHAEVAREMVATGDHVTLHVNGVRYLEKAPLPYWLVALGYKALGVSEFATRLPTILAVLLTVVLAVGWASRAWGEQERVFLFVPPDQEARAKNSIPRPWYIVAKSSGKTIYSNRR